MKKRTHLLLTKYILQITDNKFTKFEKCLVCFGSIIPDLTILCLIRPHCWNVTLNYSYNRFSTLRHFSYKYRECLKLGLLSHHIADYFTAPHNRVGISGFCLNHRDYESELDKVFVNNISHIYQIQDLSEISKSDFWSYLITLHSFYMKEKESYFNDMYYIFNAVDSLFASVVYA